MTVLDVVVTGLTVAANLGIGIAGMSKARFVVANAKAVNVGASSVPLLGALKAAGAVGLLVGLAGIDIVGIAAGVGLVAFFVGAVVFHVRARALDTLAFPVAYLTLAVASLVFAITR